MSHFRRVFHGLSARGIAFGTLRGEARKARGETRRTCFLPRHFPDANPCPAIAVDILIRR